MDIKLFVSVLMMALVRQSVSLTSNGVHLTSTFISNTSLILSCHIDDSSCCKNIDEVEFKKSSSGMCSLNKCDGTYDQPMTIPDTKYHLCGCAGEETKQTYLNITYLTDLDYGNWTCTCYKAEKKSCISNVLAISQDTLLKTIEGQSSRNDDIPLMISSPQDIFLLPIVFIVGVIVTVIIIGVVMVLMRRNITQRRGPTESNQLSRFGFKLLGLRKEDFLDPDTENAIIYVTHNTEEATSLLSSSSSVGAQSSVPEMKEEVIRSVQDMINQDDTISKAIYRLIPNSVHGVTQRLLTPNVCYCGYCVELSYSYFKCCKDEPSEKECMSLSEDFKEKCLNEEALRKTLDLSKYKKENQRMYFLRHAAYRQCCIIDKGSKEVGGMYDVCPSCCRKLIRERFPDSKKKYDGNTWILR